MKKIILFLALCYWVNVNGQVELEQSNLPIVIIDTNGASILDEPKIEADMGIIYNGEGQMNLITDPFNNYNGKIGIELRGATSQVVFPKKQYAIETRNALGENNNVPLLGLPKENDWILHAPYSDKTLIRNALAYTLAGRMMSYAPRFKFVEVVLNGEYMGVYLLIEKIKRDNDRIAISKLEPEDEVGDDLTGGYILKIDKSDGSNTEGFTSNYTPFPGSVQTTVYQYHYPKPDNITEVQKTYIQNYIDDFESVMDSDNFADPIEGYSKHIDKTTFIDYLLINELAKNIDAYRISTFLYKDKDSEDGRLKMGPVWDFNLGFGNVDFCMGPEPEDWVLDYVDFCPDDFWLAPFWWQKLRNDTAFQKEVNMRWVELRSNVLSNTSINATIDSMTLELNNAQQRNFEKWPVLTAYVWPNSYVGNTYSNEIVQLRNWITYRLNWMDGKIAEFCERKYITQDYFDPIAYPNPFTEQVKFEYYVPENMEVEIIIYNTLGQIVKNLVDNDHPNGRNSLTWYNSNNYTGVYFYLVYFGDELRKRGTLFCNK